MINVSINCALKHTPSDTFGSLNEWSPAIKVKLTSNFPSTVLYYTKIIASIPSLGQGMSDLLFLAC